ncbi:MAG: molecular chaperone DnaK [Flavobacterium sp. BFFFF2]|nr:MAG: molecular chaperone DnaK [Flavobacterium sp. BFFFF2]
MKKTKMVLGLSLIAVSGLIFMAADHADAPAVSGNANDITDVYAFQGQDSNNLVFVINTQGLLSPNATAAAAFNENVLQEINIDTNGDNVEDLVIQAIRKGTKMYFYGPVAPSTTGTVSTIKTAAASGSVDISQYGSAPITATENGMKFFAGPRDDPFFFDLGQFKHILAGDATSFNNPGTDTFAGTNVLSTIIEVPKSMLGSGSTINIWAETKQKQ